MEWLQSIVNNGTIIAVLALVVSFVGLIITLAHNYHTVPPNKVAIVFGRTRKSSTEGAQKRGYRVVAGGGFLIWPIVEQVQYMSLNVMTFQLNVLAAPDTKGAPVSVTAIANVKVLSEEGMLGLAVERFLGFSTEQIQSVARENLESNLRAIVGTLTIEQLINDRQSLQSSVMREAEGDLKKLGLGVDLLNIQNVSDDQGYIGSLGKKRTAEVKRDADIGAAEANRDTALKVASATQASEEGKANAERAISDARRTKELAVAENMASVGAMQARIAIKAKIAAAEEQKVLNQADVDAEKTRETATTELQDIVKKRREAEINATVVVDAEGQRKGALIKADADRQALMIQADAQQQAAEKQGEARRILAEKEGQGEQAKLTAQAIGRKAAADANRVEQEAEASGARASYIAVADGERAKLLAEAEGSKAKLLAEAEGTKAKLLAAAEGTRAQLLAQAEGALKQAEAYKALDDSGRFLMILDASPKAIDALGKAFAAALTPVAGAIGQGLGAIDEVRIVDMGGKSGEGTLLSQFANLPIQTITTLYQQARAAGAGDLVKQIATKAGITLPAEG